MKSEKIFNQILFAFVMLALSIVMFGCETLPRGTTSEIRIDNIHLQARGAGIVKVVGDNTTFRIKCNECGYQSDDMRIETPTFDKPYSIEWNCPKCGHRQKVLIEVKER